MMRFTDGVQELLVFCNAHGGTVTFVARHSDDEFEDFATTTITREEVQLLAKTLAAHVGFELVAKPGG